MQKRPSISSRPFEGSPMWILCAALAAWIAAPAAGGDDFPDIVTTDLDSLWVFHGDGEGGFSDPTQYSIEADVEPWALAIADLTGDGLPELLSANRYGPHLSIFTNLGGEAFDPFPRFIDTAEAPYDVDAGDLDLDGDNDVVVTCNFDPGLVLLLFNDGDGTFSRTDTIAAGGKTFNSVLVDLDGKSGPDLIVVRNTSRDLAVYLNAGDGTFGFHGTVAAGTDPKAIKAGDLDGDGLADAVVANDSAGYVTVFIGDGTGGLQLRRTYSCGSQPRELVLPDLSGDGIPDMVVAGGRGSYVVSRFIGNGDGTFEGPVDYVTGPRPNSVDAADFDLDGKADVAAANWSLDNESLASMTVLFGDGAGAFPRQNDFVAPGGFRKITAVAAGQLDQTRFLRGDATFDGRLTVTDGIFALRYLFSHGKLSCLDAADFNDSGRINVTDAIDILNYLFRSGAPPAPPFPEKDVDPTPDDLGCL
jgi:hypothetical protein